MEILNKIHYLIQKSILMQFFILLFFAIFITILIYMKLKTKDLTLLITYVNDKQKSISGIYEKKEGKKV